MEATFTKLIEISMIASWLISIILVLRFCFKKASKSFYVILWGIVGLRLVFPFSIESIFSLIPSKDIIQPTIQTGIITLDEVLQQNIQIETLPQSMNWMSFFTIVWIIGMFALCFYGMISYYRLYKKVSICLPFKDTIYYCDSIDSPFILGIIHPKIYLPSTLDESQIEYILKHENAHLKRKDHLWKPLGFALLTIYWFNPMIWIAYIYLCKDIESACDELVIKEMDAFNKKMYSETLFTCSVERNLIMACPLAFGEIGVKERIKSIVNYKKPSFWVLCISLVACIILCIGFLTEPKTNGKVTDFTFTTGLLNKEIKLNKVQKEYVLELLDNYTFNHKVNNEMVYGGSFYHIHYVKNKISYNWSISSNQTYLEINDGGKTTAYFGDNNRLLYELNKYDSLAQESIENNNQFKMIDLDTKSLTSQMMNGIMNQNKHSKLDGLIRVESHVTLANEQSTNAKDVNEVVESTHYLIVLYQEFILANNEPQEVYRSYSPAIITFDVNDKEYILKDYWQPNEGENYQKEIMELFPGDTSTDAIFNQKYLEELEKENLQKVKDYLSTIEMESNSAKAFDELYTFIKNYDNGYTDEDYRNAKGEECLHPRGEYINANLKSIKVRIDSDPHRLFSYIIYISNTITNEFYHIYMYEDNYPNITQFLNDKGYVRIIE